jgi:hypothetical protein
MDIHTDMDMDTHRDSSWDRDKNRDRAMNRQGQGHKRIGTGTQMDSKRDPRDTDGQGHRQQGESTDTGGQGRDTVHMFVCKDSRLSGGGVQYTTNPHL